MSSHRSRKGPFLDVCHVTRNSPAPSAQFPFNPVVVRPIVSELEVEEEERRRSGGGGSSGGGGGGYMYFNHDISRSFQTP